MADRNMGPKLERAQRIQIIRTGEKAPAVASTLAMHKQLGDFLDKTPTPDKDAVEEDLGLVRRRLGAEADGLAERALSGNAWEVARAQSEIGELLQPRPPLTTQHQPFRVGMTVQGLTLSDRKPRIIPEQGIISRALGKAIGLYRHVASGRVSGLKAKDVDTLVNDVRDGDREKQLRVSREILKITAPIEERTKKR